MGASLLPTSLPSCLIGVCRRAQAHSHSPANALSVLGVLPPLVAAERRAFILRPIMSPRLLGLLAFGLLLAGWGGAVSGCSRRATLVEEGRRSGTLHVALGAEPGGQRNAGIGTILANLRATGTGFWRTEHKALVIGYADAY